MEYRCVKTSEGFVRAQWRGTWRYSSYLVPSLFHDAYCKVLEDLAIDARGKHPVPIAGDFYAQERGCPTTNASGRTLLKILGAWNKIVRYLYVTCTELNL